MQVAPVKPCPDVEFRIDQGIEPGRVLPTLARLLIDLDQRRQEHVPAEPAAGEEDRQD